MIYLHTFILPFISKFFSVTLLFRGFEDPSGTDSVRFTFWGSISQTAGFPKKKCLPVVVPLMYMYAESLKNIPNTLYTLCTINFYLWNKLNILISWRSDETEFFLLTCLLNLIPVPHKDISKKFSDSTNLAGIILYFSVLTLYLSAISLLACDQFSPSTNSHQWRHISTRKIIYEKWRHYVL